MKKLFYAASFLSLAFLASCKKDFKENELNANSTVVTGGNAIAIQEKEKFFDKGGITPGSFVPNEFLVKFNMGTSATGRANALARVSAQIQEHVLTKMMERFGDEGFYVVHTPLAAQEAIGKMKGLPEVAFAEPNWVYSLSYITDDPYYTNGTLWGMYGSNAERTNEFGSQANRAWIAGKTGLSSVVVGIIDEGVMYAHQDLDANIWTNPVESLYGNNGKDDDGNGYVDDIRGWDFAGNNNTTYDGTQDDHGTHVAGTIGAEGKNGIGVAGVCWNVKIITAKFLGNRGGTTANAVKAVDYINDLKARYNLNLVATNNSWGGGGYSQALSDAIQRAADKNILFVAAAGNDTKNIDASLSYPASYSNDNIISVASIEPTKGDLSYFSNWGAKNVDLGAPGSGIYSTVPGKNNTSAYAKYSGTSMATPHVTGAVALYAAYHSGADAATIKNAIMIGTIPTGSLSGKTVSGGRLDIYNSLSK